MIQQAATILFKRIFHHRKKIMISWWIILVLLITGFVLFEKEVIDWFTWLFVTMPLIGYLLYFILVSVRGLTFIPLTTILLAVAPFMNQWILWIITLAWTLITSYIIYYFSQALQLDDYFEKNHERAIKVIRKRLDKYELPVIIIWSMIPITPTDLICYIAWTLGINVRKMLWWVLIGEGLVCIVYIWWIQSIFGYFMG
jgi:uncharacterized membrane protein YdjX (TVP38/TMEM64 family)